MFQKDRSSSIPVETSVSFRYASEEDLFGVCLLFSLSLVWSNAQLYQEYIQVTC